MTVKEYAIEKTTLEPSAEIQDLMIRFYEALSTDDFEKLDRLVSRQGLLWIGTDPTEWWEDAEAVMKALRTQTAEMGGPVAIASGGATAYKHGDVVWVADRPVFRLSDGRTLPFRLTAVWLREPEGWRIVQAHVSFGVANETVVRSK